MAYNPTGNDKRKLVIVITILLAIGFLATSLFSYQASRASIRAEIVDQELPLTSDSIYSEIQKDLIRPVFIASMMASDTFLRDWAINGEGEGDATAIAKYLNEIKVRYQAFTAFFVTEKSRRYYHADGLLKSVREDEPRDRWYFRVRDLKEAYETNVDPDLANRDALTIFINYRVLDYNGRFIGATGVGLSVDSVHRLIRNYQERFHRRIYFVDRQGDFVHLGNSGSQSGSMRDVEGLSGIADAILAAKSNSFHYTRQGQSVLLNSRYIPDLGWHLIVERVEEDALGAVRQTLLTNLVICLTVVGLVLFLTTLTLNRYQRRLEEMATTDKVTGLLNRQSFEILMHKSFADFHRKRRATGILVIDIDFFKRVNDQHGHLQGDRVLREVATLIGASLRDADYLCRWGGEEFVVVTRECSLEQTLGIAEKLRAGVEAHDFGEAGQALKVTISLGVTELQDNDSTPEQALSRADTALLTAKRDGRNRVACA